jgi:hypothetical protein
MPAGLQCASKVTQISLAVLFFGYKMKYGTVVPEVVSILG